MTTRAQVGDADLVVQGVVDGEQRGWLLQPSGMFRPDSDTGSEVAASALMALAQTPGQQLTFTAVPPGSGERIALDRDENAVLNADEPVVVGGGGGGGSSSTFFYPLLFIFWWFRRRSLFRSPFCRLVLWRGATA
jgi:hypothetical protein